MGGVVRGTLRRRGLVLPRGAYSTALCYGEVSVGLAARRNVWPEFVFFSPVGEFVLLTASARWLTAPSVGGNLYFSATGNCAV